MKIIIYFLQWWMALGNILQRVFLNLIQTARSLETSLMYKYHWNISGMLTATAKSLQSCPTLCDPVDGSPPGSPSLGFSRQEGWSGLPFPSPTHESEKWKWSCSVVSNPQWPHGLQPSRLLHPWDFPGKSTGVRCHCLLQLRVCC